jgi:hypothetical protein
MKRRRWEIAVLVIGLIVLALVAVGRQQAQYREPPSVYSTNDTGPNGYRALYEVLRAANVPATRFGRLLTLLDPKVRTLVITRFEDDPMAGEEPIDENDAKSLTRFVHDGGRLVAIDTDFAGKADLAPNVGTTVEVKDSSGAIALAKGPFTQGVRQIDGPVDAIFRFNATTGVPLLANQRGVVATYSTYGKGEVIAISAPRLFSNAHLRDGDNAAFAYNAIAGHGPVAFDEYVHGYDDNLSMWSVLPRPMKIALYIVLGIVLLAVLGAAIPFAPTVPLEPPDERDSSAYLDAMAALLRRANAAREAIAQFAADGRKRVRHVQTDRMKASIGELEVLETVPRPTGAQVVRAAALDYRLRKDTP